MASEKGTTSFLQETLIPLLSGIIDLGQPGQRWRNIWTKRVDISDAPLIGTDAANKTYVDAAVALPTFEEVDGVPSIANSQKLQFDQADGFVVSNPVGTTARVDLSAVPTSVLAGPITQAKGGTNIDTSASTGVPVVDAGTWTVPATLAVSKGGTGQSSAGAGYVKGGNPMTLQATPLPAADLGTGATSSKFLRGDQTWQQSSALSQAFRNLHIRTHPDNDKVANQVALLNLDEVVMDDGSRYVNVVRAGTDAPLTADITVAGAGGLDTGARVASTWYESYLIGKSSTQANADLRLLLHRAKDYFLDQSQTAGATSDALRDVAADTRLAQGIKVATTGKVERVDILTSKSGSPTGNVWIEIQSDSAGSPSGTILATSDKFDASKLSGGGVFVAFIFRNPANLTAATQYHIVFNGDYTISAVNFINWGGNVADVYANGAAKKANNGVWSAATNSLDFRFKVYVTRNDTAVTMPAGYDQKALLAPGFFNNSGNAFDAVLYMNHRHKLLTRKVSGSISATTPTLFDLSSMLPPRVVVVDLAYSANVATATGIFGPVPQGFGIGASNTAGQDSTLGALQSETSASASDFPVELGQTATEFQAGYVAGDGVTVLTYYVRGWEW